jgi:hypothetical protein
MSQNPEGMTFEETIEKIVDSLPPEGQQDFIKLLSVLDSGTGGGNPAAIMKVNEDALRNFINVAVTTIRDIIKKTSGAEVILPPMLFASGMLVGYSFSQVDTKEDGPSPAARLEAEALEAIERSGFKTQGDVHAVMGGDVRMLEDPLVKRMLAMLPPGSRQDNDDA